ncbi:Polyadenylate-binding protein like [Argiope bruennichi]|uniref:Polyadenylate-binding protein like n=1 Tax=Argiope bruennichi TaxID=94029 RepID=A0A8T0EL94_ARGBR|nr:Polyadenylate-binding protein like [Argiope bruennichi]
MSNSILIENLNRRTDVSKLCEMFGKFGRILSANIETDSNLSSLCKGHITYDTSHSAHYAVKEMNGRNSSGRPIYVKHEETFTSPANSTESSYYKKIFVKNIDLSWDDYNLIGEFERFGEIEDAKVSQTDGQSNGYGFVKFQAHSSAKMAVDAMHNKMIDDRKLIVQPFTHKDKNKASSDSIKRVQEKFIQANNLFIKNLPKDMDENELKDIFKKCGAIQSVRIATDMAQNSKGYGFVCFYSEVAAAKARNQINGLSYKSKTLEVDFYRKKSDYNPAHSKIKESEKETDTFFSSDRKTVFSFSAKG